MDKNMNTKSSIQEAMVRHRQWSQAVATAAAAYVVLPIFLFTRAKSNGKYRVRLFTDIVSRGLAQQVYESANALVIGLRNALAPNKRGIKPELPEIFLETIVKADLVPLRGKHLINDKAQDEAESPFSLLSKIFTTFKAGTGYIASLFSACVAGMTWHNVPYIVDYVRGADGLPAGSDGGGLYLADENNPVWQALRGKSAQVRILSRTKGFFAKGMISPITKKELVRLAPHLANKNAWIIIDPSMFKAGASVSIPAGHPTLNFGLKQKYDSYKDFFCEAASAGINDLGGDCSLGVLRVKRRGRTSLNAGALLRLETGAVPTAKKLLEASFQKFLLSGGVHGVINGLIDQERERNLAELRNVSVAFDTMNEMMKEEGNPLHFDILGVKAVRDQVLDSLGRKFWRMATGLGVRGVGLVGRIDNSIPPGVVILPPGIVRHGQKVTVWRQPIVTTTGVANFEAWVLCDSECPSDIKERYSYLQGCEEFIANELVIVYQFQGDNDGDDFGVSGDPLVVEMYDQHRKYIFEPNELFSIEGTKERGIRSKAAIGDSKVGLGRDYRGPIGIQTNIQLAGLAHSKESLILGMMRSMQFSVDQAKKDLPNPDFRIDADRATWRKVEIPGWPGYSAWTPSDAILDADMEDSVGYPDIMKLMQWVKANLGMSLRDAMPWNRKGKKLTLKDLRSDPITPEANIADMIWNHFLTLVRESNIDLEAEGEILVGQQLLDLLKWKAGYSETITAMDPTSRYYRDLITRSGLRKHKSQKKQILDAYKGANTAEEAADKSQQLAAARETLISTLNELTTEERLTIWLTDCQDGRYQTITRAYRAIFLGDNEITRMLGCDDFTGCSFIGDNHEEFIKRVKAAQQCPSGDMNLHRFGDAGIAVLAGCELYRKDGEIAERPAEETLNSRHEELFGAPILDCEVCMSRARRLLVNEFRWTPPGSTGEFAAEKAKEINSLLSDPRIQEAIHNAVAPHYEDDEK